jgi:hypothetical protein
METIFNSAEKKDKTREEVANTFQQPKGSWQEALAKWADRNLRPGTAQADDKPKQKPQGY